MQAFPPDEHAPGSGSADDFRSPFDEDIAFVVVREGDPALPSLLPAEEALIPPRAAARYVADFRLGRAAARIALRALGVPDRPILRGAHREPRWPDGVVGAISHAAGYALAAVGRTDRFTGLGLDLERRVDMRDITSRIAIPAERLWLEAYPDEERQLLALLLFSAKESVFKAFFPSVREYFGFDRAHLRWDPDDQAFHGALLPPLDRVSGAARFRVDCQRAGDLVLTSVQLRV